MPQAEELPPTVSVRQAAKLLGWHPGLLTREIEQKRFPIPAIQKGSRVVIPTRPLLALIHDGAQPAQEAA